MDHQEVKLAQRRRRHLRVRRKVSGDAERQRLCVFRSLKQMYCQVIDDIGQRSIGGCSTLTPRLREELTGKSRVEAARIVGKEIARISLAKGVTKVAFDRGGYRYHGRVKALAEAAREGGLKF